MIVCATVKVDVRHLCFIIYWYTGHKFTVEWEFDVGLLLLLLVNLLLLLSVVECGGGFLQISPYYAGIGMDSACSQRVLGFGDALWTWGC